MSYLGTPLSEAAEEKDEGGKKPDKSGLSVAKITCAEELQSALHGKPSDLAAALDRVFKVWGVK